MVGGTLSARSFRRAAADSDSRATDRGATFVEVLVAIVLLGTVIVGTLAALRASVIGTRLERDHAKAHQWLQSAVGVVEDEPFGDCNTVSTDKVIIVDKYQDAIDADASKPDGFGGSITVTDLDVWNGTGWVDFGSQPIC